MIVRFTAEGLRDFGYWEATNPRLVTKINIPDLQHRSIAVHGLGKARITQGKLVGLVEPSHYR